MRNIYQCCEYLKMFKEKLFTDCIATSVVCQALQRLIYVCMKDGHKECRIARSTFCVPHWNKLTARFDRPLTVATAGL